VLCKVVEATQADMDKNQWGQIKVVKLANTAKETRVVHEPAKKNKFMEAGAKGTHDTTKKIVSDSIATRQKLVEIDEVI